MRRLLVVLGVLLPALGGIEAAAAATPAFHLSDHRIDEASGIATGIRSPGVIYVQNDSGDSARFFAVDASNGRTLAEYDVPGAAAVDWEDIAVARDASGTPSVWLADIGDNMRRRTSVQLYRVDEPVVDRARHDVVAPTGRPDVWRLRYPSGPVDAESLAVSPHGVPYLVTKALDGNSAVYAAPSSPDASRVRTLTRIATIRFTFTGTPGPYAPIGQLTATGAALSQDGTRFAVRTYTDAYLWQLHDGDLAAALHRRPLRIALPRQPQGEGICFAGAKLLIDSEGKDSVVYRVPVPVPAPAPRTSTSPPTASRQPPSEPAADLESTPKNDILTYALAAVAALAIAALASAEALRRRRS